MAVRAVTDGDFGCRTSYRIGRRSWDNRRAVDIMIDALARSMVERGPAESTLRENEALFRSLAETLPAGIVILQKERIEDLNPVMERMSGYTREEILATSF